jgi:ParB family chromosome partitioning protein
MVAPKKIALSPSRDIPFNKLCLSQANVRHIKAGVSIEELADDIARRGLLQGLNVRAVIDADGNETGMFEIPAGGRRYRALELLVKRKRLANTAPVPCVLREGGLAEEDSLAENIQRAPLHPLDQFRAFLALKEKGQSEEEIAAVFFVSVQVVKQRLKLASVSPKLLDAYAEDELTLDQLMAFAVSGDHERQERVFERLQHAYDKQPYAIRRMLTEGAARASDKRVRFIGLDAYLDAGGVLLRDLFQGDDGGWLEDIALVDRMVAEKLESETARIAAEGWKWVEAAPDFAYGHNFGLRRLRGEPVPLSPEEESARDAAREEYNRLSEQYSSAEELPDEIDRGLGELEAQIQGFESRPLAFDPAELTRAGAFVSIAPDGSLRVERGYVRPEDELPVEPQAETELEVEAAAMAARFDGDDPVIAAAAPMVEMEEDEGMTPISDRLMTELTAHRTLGLRQSLGERPDVAFLAALHALTLKAFYRYSQETCLDLDLKGVAFGAQAPGLNDSACAEAIRARHDRWQRMLPKESAGLWDALQSWDGDNQAKLFAHVVSLSVNAMHETWNRRTGALAHADRLAEAVDLDMATAGWRPTIDNFFGRVAKARILQAVTEAKGQRAADRIAHLKKGEMAREAEGLLAISAWLPEPLRTPGRARAGAGEACESQPVTDELPDCESETPLGDEETLVDTDDDNDVTDTIAAE